MTRTPARKPSQTRSASGSRSGTARRVPKRITTNRNQPRVKAKRTTPKLPLAPDTSAAPLLSPRRRRDLRGEAHALQPLVQVGHEGVTPAVVAAVSSALRDHELIKVRLHEPEDKKAMAKELAAQSRSALCGLLGHTVILYKPRPITDPPKSTPSPATRSSSTR